MSIDWGWAKLDAVVEWAKASGSWRADVRDVVVTPSPDGGIERRVVDVLVPPAGPTYRAEASRLDRNKGAKAEADFAVLAINSFGQLVAEADEARALLRMVWDQLDEDGRAAVDRLLAQPTVREQWDERNSGGF